MKWSAYVCTVSAVLLTLQIGASYGASPNGFVIWSEGGHEKRGLKYIQILAGSGPEASTKKDVVQRGTYADIEPVISKDGKFVAFARQIAHYSGCCTDNPGDYHGFGNYDVYVAPLTGALPSKPVKVGQGYLPSWGDNSDQPTKTLYYSWCEGMRGPALKIMKATVSSRSLAPCSAAIPAPGPASLFLTRSACRE